MTTIELSNLDVDAMQFENADRHQMRERAAHFIKRLVTFLPIEAPDYMSEHNHLPVSE